MRIKFFVVVIAVALLLSPIVEAGSTNFVNALDVDFSSVRGKVFSQEELVPFLKLGEAISSDFVFTDNGLWMKIKSDFIVPVIFTSDFEMEIKFISEGLVPVADPLAALKAAFPVAKSVPEPQYYNIELWPYAIGKSETLEKMIGTVQQISSSKIDYRNSGYYEYYPPTDDDGKRFPIRITLAKEKSQVGYHILSASYSSITYNKPYAAKKHSQSLTDAKPIILKEDGLHSIVIKKEEGAIFISIDGQKFDLSTSVFNGKAAAILSIKGSLQIGMTPSATEAVYIKSIRIVAPEGTFFNIKDVIAAQK